MSSETQEIIDRALALSEPDKALIVDELLSSMNAHDDEIDALWRREVEDRVAAYRSGALKSFPLEEVLAKYQK